MSDSKVNAPIAISAGVLGIGGGIGGMAYGLHRADRIAKATEAAIEAANAARTKGSLFRSGARAAVEYSLTGGVVLSTFIEAGLGKQLKSLPKTLAWVIGAPVVGLGVGAGIGAGLGALYVAATRD